MAHDPTRTMALYRILTKFIEFFVSCSLFINQFHMVKERQGSLKQVFVILELLNGHYAELKLEKFASCN